VGWAGRGAGLVELVGAEHDVREHHRRRLVLKVQLQQRGALLARLAGEQEAFSDTDQQSMQARHMIRGFL